MKATKTTLIKPKKVKEKEKQKLEWLAPLLLLVLGIILFTDSSRRVIIVFYVIGALILFFGIFRLISYYRLKKELKIEDNQKLVIGTSTIFVGILVILLSGAIEVFLRFILGFLLIINGLKKVIVSLNYKNYIVLLEGILFIGIGLYTILAQNIVFQIIGVLLIASSIIDFTTYIIEKRKTRV